MRVHVLLVAMVFLPGVAAGPWSGGEPPLVSHFMPLQAEPVVVGDLLVTSVPTGDGENPYLGGRDLVAFDASGTQAWRKTIIPDGAPYMDGNVQLKVAGDGRHIVVQDTYARMWLLDAATRETVWHLPGPEDPRGSSIWSAGPMLVDGRIVAVEDDDPSVSRSEAVVRGRSLEDGSALWTHRGVTAYQGRFGDDLVLAGGNMLQRIDTATGQVLAEYFPQEPGRGWLSGVHIEGDTIVTVTENSRETAAGDVWERRLLFEVWSPDFERQGSFTTSWFVPTPRWSERTFDVVDGTLVAVFENRLASMDLATWQEHWSVAPQDLDGGPWVIDGQVLYTTMDQSNGQRIDVHAVSLADGSSLGPPLRVARPFWGGFVEVGGVLGAYADTVVPGQQRTQFGMILFGDDTEAPTWPEWAGIGRHEQSHETRIEWQAMVDWNPGTYLVEGARSPSGPWTHIGTTSHADSEGGGYLDPGLSLAVDDSYTHFRVTPSDRAGNAGPPLLSGEQGQHPEWNRTQPDDPPPDYERKPEPEPEPETLRPRSEVEVVVEPDPVVAGDEMRIVVRVRSDTPFPDEATAVLESGNGSALRVPISLKDATETGHAWSGRGTLAAPAPAAGEHVYRVRVEVRRGQDLDPAGLGEPFRVPVHVLESSPTGVRLGDLGLDRTFASEGEELTAFVELVSQGGPHHVTLRLLLGEREVTRTRVLLEEVPAGGGRGTLVEMPFRYDGVSTSVTVVAATGDGEVRRSMPVGDGGASLVLSVGLLNLGNIESEGQRTIPVEVTAYNEDALDVWLRVLDDGGLTVRSLTPPTRVPAGQTITFYLQVEADGLDGNATAENRRLVLQAVASNTQSNVETINLVQHEKGFLGIPALGPGGVVAALAAVGAAGAGFRRRHGSG